MSAISQIGLEIAESVTWACNDAEFTKMARICFGLPTEGPPPMWHFLNAMRQLDSILSSTPNRVTIDTLVKQVDEQSLETR